MTACHSNATIVVAPARDFLGARQALLRAVAAAVFMIAIALPWFSAGDHALYPPDEGRYATVAMHMADGGDWLVPQFEERVHLTKPPLVYWLQALSLRVIGHDELAVRLPSLIASSLLMLLVLRAGQTWSGSRLGVLAVATLACMPLHAIVSRLAVTDAPLSLCWFAALLGGVRAVQTSAARWACLLWIAIAVGLLIKGPIALTPLAVVAVWLALGSNLRGLARLHLFIGFPLAIAPALVWAMLVVRQHPEAVSIWFGQTIGRLTGEGGTNAHVRPLWFYLPILIGGLFPATVMLTLPWLNIGWRSAWRSMRTGDENAFWILAVVIPLIFFLAMSGKLATYLLPLAAPMALLAARTLEHWLSGRYERPVVGFRPPEIVLSLMIVSLALLAIAGTGVLLLDKQLLWLIAPLSLLVAASAWLHRTWIERPQWREAGLLAVWLTGMMTWASAFEMEDGVRARTDPRVLLDRIANLSSDGPRHIAITGFRDPCVEFYARRSVSRADTAASLKRLIDQDGSGLLVLMDAADWQEFGRANPSLAQQMSCVGQGVRWFNKSVDILQPLPRDASAARVSGTPAR